jgi:hypothetical protein
MRQLSASSPAMQRQLLLAVDIAARGTLRSPRLTPALHRDRADGVRWLGPAAPCPSRTKIFVLGAREPCPSPCLPSAAIRPNSGTRA